MIKADGQAVTYAWPEAFGRLLNAVLGADSIASVNGSLTDHTISPVASLPYFTLEQKWADEKERVVDAKVTQLDIDCEAGRPLKLTANTISGGTVFKQTAADLTATRESGRPLFFPLASLVMTGASGAKVTKMTVSIKRGVDDAIQTNSLSREDVVETTQDYTVDATLKYEDESLWARAQYGGGTVAGLDLATSSIDFFTAQTAGTGQQARLVLPLLEIVGIKVNRLDPDGKTMYYDVSMQSVQGATNPCFGVIRCGATAAF